MSATPRTDETSIEFLKRYQLWRSGKDTRTMTEAGILPSDITKHLNAVIESADVSAALIAELREVINEYLDAQHALDNRELSGPYAADYGSLVKARNSAARELDSALAKTPESVGADLAKLREENQKLRAIFPRILERLKSGGCAPECSVEFMAMIADEVGAVTDELRASVAQKDARIAKLETTNKDQLDSLSFCKGEIANLEHDRNISEASAQMMADDVKEAQDRMEKAESRTERLAAALRNLTDESRSMVRVMDSNLDLCSRDGETSTYCTESTEAFAAAILEADAAVKQSGNHPETPAGSAEAERLIDGCFGLLTRFKKEYVMRLDANHYVDVTEACGELRAYIAARKTGGVQP